MKHTELTSSEFVKIVGYRPAPDGLSLELTFESGGGATFDRVEQGPNGPRTLAALREKATVLLARPLRERKVVDATSGKRVRRGGVPRL